MNLVNQKVDIAEVFYSQQMEIDIGRGRVFIRFSGCNLIKRGAGCLWCDTKYAEEGKERYMGELVKEIMGYSCRNLVIAGGEPLLQLEGVFFLVDALSERDTGFTFDIETNGTIYDARLFQFRNINCSPKRQALDLNVLRRIVSLPQTRFKFVYEKDEPKWWEEIINTLYIHKERVWIMPQGVTREEQLELGSEVIEYCKDMQFNFTPRFHIIQWGNKRGV